MLPFVVDPMYVGTRHSDLTLDRSVGSILSPSQLVDQGNSTTSGTVALWILADHVVRR